MMRAIVVILGGILSIAVASCAEDGPKGNGDVASLEEEAVFVWPSELNIVGTYPSPGNNCRRVGDSEAVREMSEAGKTLVACPSHSDAAALDGEIVGKISDVSIVAVEATTDAAP